MEIIDENKFNNEVYDDDQYINDCRSLRRRLLIVEKIIVIFLAVISFPVGFLIMSTFDNSVIQIVNNFTDSYNLFVFILISVLDFLALLTVLFATKSFSFYKGVPQNIVINIVLSFGVFLCCSAFTIKGAWVKSAICGATFFSVFSSLGVLIVQLINIFNQKVILILGPKDDAENVARKIIKANKKRTKIRYVFYEIDGKIDERIYSKFCRVNQIILLDTLSYENKEKFLLYFNSCLNKDVYLTNTYYDIISQSVSTKVQAGLLCGEQKPFTIDKIEMLMKRIFDVLCSIVLLIFTLPIFIIVPILIKLDSKGPVFYRQVRYTKNLKEFKIFKFRSMYIDADPNKAALKGDKRITKVGKVIRACRIDEIPQVLNVLRGEMSFVGPRALMHGDVDPLLQSDPVYKYRFNVLAGITGLQQVTTSPGADYKEKLKYDLYYISHYSLAYDITILFQTVITVFKKEMADGIDEENDNFTHFLTENGKEYNVHKTYVRVVNHKRNFNKETGLFEPVKERKKLFANIKK